MKLRNSPNYYYNGIRKDFFTFDQLRDKVRTQNFVKYFSLLANIPTDVKQFIKNNFTVENNFHAVDNFLTKLVNNKNIKYVYNQLIDQHCIIPNEKFLKWENELQIDIPDMSKYFIMNKKCSVNTYLFNFQYRFLHRVIPTNDFLHKIHLIDTNLCTFCRSDVETVHHLFYDCNITNNFLNLFFNCLKNYYQELEMKKDVFFLGIPNNDILLNLLLIIAKNFIFKCKLDDKHPHIIGLKRKIGDIFNLELFISKKNFREEKLRQLWAPVDDIFPNLL